MAQELGVFKPLDVRGQWPTEASDFTPWLAQERNMEELAKALGLELELQAVEAKVGPYAADILAKDTGTGKYVVIENQLEKTNHDHLGKAITYGSVLDAGAIVWIAREFTEEHHRALDWLNDITSEDFAFYGVVLELWQIDDSKPAVRFNVISRPAEIKRGTPGSGTDELSEARQLQLEFWTQFREKVLAAKIVPSAQKARAQYWFDVPVGRSHFFLSNVANTYENRVGVRLYIGNKVADRALPQLETERKGIEEAIGESLEWNPNPDNRDKVIALYRSANLWDRSSWPEIVDWLVDRVGKFRKVFMPRVKKLNLSDQRNPPPKT